MKITALRFLLLAVASVVLSNCAPTMYVQTEGNTSGMLSKSALHYIVPPTATDSVDVKNLYPFIVSAFESNHIALTKDKKNAAFLVTWGTESQSKQMHTVQTVNGSPDWYGNLNVNSYAYGPGTAGMSATGPQYIPVVRSYRMQNFSIHVWKNDPASGSASTPVWSGSATAGATDVKNPATIINDIVARYGTNFAGHSEIRSN
jgi:hypothetical protein